MDIPKLLLAAATRRMPVERREWGAAMLAELAHIQNPFTRWRFALDCAPAALLGPRRGGLLQSMNDKTKRIVRVFGASALIGLILVAPFVFLELRYGSGSYSNPPISLFGLLWALGTIFLITVASMAQTARVGGGLLAHPVTLSLRLIFLLLVAWCWGFLIIDQLPCFLGVPNCD
jgi:hypothetical protein